MTGVISEKETERRLLKWRTERSLLKKILDFIGTVFPLIVVVILFTQVLFACTCASGSMEPTLNVGNTVFYNRLAYVRNTIQRGDIVAFQSDEFGAVFAKRVIGIPGDVITFESGYVVVNGSIADESDYLDPDIETNSSKTFVVPEGTVFMLGDNRENSLDSRFWENPYIPIDKIKGKYIGQIPFSVWNDIIRPVVNIISKK